jgi:hypothetical protein
MITKIVSDYELIYDVPEKTGFVGGSAAIKDIIFYIFPDSHTKKINVLDIGFGVGLLGEFIKSSPLTKHWEIDGVDGFFDTCCNKELFQKKIYRNIWHGLAQDLGTELLGQYDLLCLLDVIEHLDAEPAKNLLGLLLRALTPEGRLYLSTPLFFYPQGQIQHGDLEEHRMGVPASSALALRPMLYSINLDGLCGNFVYSRESLKYIESFSPTTDRNFGALEGLEECFRLGLSIDDGERKIYSLKWGE